MSEQARKARCKSQLEALGVRYKRFGLTITKHIAKGTTEIQGKEFKFSLSERIGEGIQIKAKGNQKSCVISYQAMMNMAEAMGLFDIKEKNNE